MIELVELLVPAALVLAIVRFVLIVKPPASASLPDPRTIPDMPIAGPASVKAAHAAMSRSAATGRPKFRT